MQISALLIDHSAFNVNSSTGIDGFGDTVLPCPQTMATETLRERRWQLESVKPPAAVTALCVLLRKSGSASQPVSFRLRDRTGKAIGQSVESEKYDPHKYQDGYPDSEDPENN